MKIVLFIGPHRAGKTTILRSLTPRLPHALAIDLDEEIAQHCECQITDAFDRLGATRFSNLSRRIVRLLENRTSHGMGLVAVGTGSVSNPEAAEKWLFRYPVVALTGSPQILYQRAYRANYQSLEHYIDIEFSEARKKLYATANLVVCVDQRTPNETANDIVSFIQTNL